MAVRGPGSRTSVCLAVCIPANLAVAIGWMLFTTVKWHQGCFLHASSHKITPVARNFGFCTHFAVRLCQVYVFIYQDGQKTLRKEPWSKRPKLVDTKKVTPKTANHFEGQSLVSMKVLLKRPLTSNRSNQILLSIIYIYKLYIVTLQKNRKGTFHCVDAGIGFYFSIFFWGSLYHAISILWFSKYRYSRFPTGSYFIIWIICYRAIFKHHLSATKTQAIPGQANLWASGCSYKRPKEDDRDAAGRWWIKWSEDQPRSDVTDSKRSTVVKPTKKDVTSRTTQEDFILSLW